MVTPLNDLFSCQLRNFKISVDKRTKVCYLVLAEREREQKNLEVSEKIC